MQAVLDALGQKTGPEDTRTPGQRQHDALEEALRRLWPRLTPDSNTMPPPDQVPWPAAPPGYECDATLIPVVTGRIDHDLLDKLTAQLKGTTPWSQRPAYNPASPGPDTHRDKIRDLILANAIALLSGPGGLASVLRTGTLPPPAASISLPLDVGTATDTIPPHLRRAVILRDKHCAAPGCFVPPAGCQIHHLVPPPNGRRPRRPTAIPMQLACGG